MEANHVIANSQVSINVLLKNYNLQQMFFGLIFSCGSVGELRVCRHDLLFDYHNNLLVTVDIRKIEHVQYAPIVAHGISVSPVKNMEPECVDLCACRG